jgi:hypothetical protein
LTRYVEDGDLSINNNHTERLARHRSGAPQLDLRRKRSRR